MLPGTRSHMAGVASRAIRVRPRTPVSYPSHVKMVEVNHAKPRPATAAHVMRRVRAGTGHRSPPLVARARHKQVGPRDGLQSEKLPVSTEQKIKLINMLSETGMSLAKPR